MSEIKSVIGRWPTLTGTHKPEPEPRIEAARRCVDRLALDDADRAELLDMLGIQ